MGTFQSFKMIMQTYTALVPYMLSYDVNPQNICLTRLDEELINISHLLLLSKN
uniref:Uncharacterized protein n=1 Tax=Arion vulgaris TaxID=1028688 RepID=A0A0B7BLF4_9EUPU